MSQEHGHDCISDAMCNKHSQILRTYCNIAVGIRYIYLSSPDCNQHHRRVCLMCQSNKIIVSRRLRSFFSVLRTWLLKVDFDEFLFLPSIYIIHSCPYLEQFMRMVVLQSIQIVLTQEVVLTPRSPHSSHRCLFHKLLITNTYIHILHFITRTLYDERLIAETSTFFVIPISNLPKKKETKYQLTIDNNASSYFCATPNNAAREL